MQFAQRVGLPALAAADGGGGDGSGGGGGSGTRATVERGSGTETALFSLQLSATSLLSSPVSRCWDMVQIGGGLFANAYGHA